MRINGIEARLNIVLEKINRLLVKCKTCIVRNDKERKKIIDAATKNDSVADGLIKVNNILVIIDCGKYDGKKPKGK